MRGTATTISGLLLIEQPGPWGRDRLRESRLDPEIGAALEERCAAAGVRPQLIRTGDRRRLDAERTVFLVHPGRSDRWMERVVIDDDRQLLDLDLSTTLAAKPPGIGTLVGKESSVFLVCTHGKKDACCASLGRPVARALGSFGGRAWESTHLGGDRFAGNIVCLPTGIYYGRVDPDVGEYIVAEHDAGRIVLDNYRGRCCDAPVSQVAEHAVRTMTGLIGLDDVVPILATARSGRTDVLVRSQDQLLCVEVRSAPQRPRVTACSAGTVGSPDLYEVLSIDTVDQTDPLDRQLVAAVSG